MRHPLPFKLFLRPPFALPLRKLEEEDTFSPRSLAPRNFGGAKWRMAGPPSARVFEVFLIVSQMKLKKLRVGPFVSYL